MSELNTLLLTLCFVGVCFVMLFQLVAFYLLWRLWKEQSEIKDTQDVIFSAATNTEEFFSDKSGFDFLAN